MNHEIRLIVNADDFGFSKSINKGILEAYKNGIVTSTSLMVNEAGAEDAAQLAKVNSGLSVGLHFVFESNLCSLDMSKVVGDLTRDLKHQYERFVELVGKKPAHLDVHQVLPQKPEVAFAFHSFAKHYNLVTRSSKLLNPVHGFYGYKGFRDTLEDISVSHLEKMLCALTPGKKWVLVCHPGYNNDVIADPYTFHREIELSSLTSERILCLIKERGIILESLNNSS